MSTAAPADSISASMIANTDESCRILTISASLDSAKVFIERVKALSASRSSSGIAPAPASTPATSSASTPPEGQLIIPWTITNRYYAADVHFYVRTVESLAGSPAVFATAAPAVVFVWAEGEPYTKHIAEIARLMSLREYEPEVALAVCIPNPSTPSASSPTAQDEDAGDIDSTLMGYGFEYVDARRVEAQRDASADVDEIEDDIPALPRVLDALSTIMWPSMKSNPSSSTSEIRGGIDLNRSMDEDMQAEHDELLQELLLEGVTGGLASPSPSSSASNSSRQESSDIGVDEEDKELLAQMHVFVKDSERKANGFAAESGSEEVPFSPYDFSSSGSSTERWVSTPLSISTTTTAASNAEDTTMSPSDMGSMTPFGTKGPSAAGEEGRQVSLGFEDDFTVFVSAPPVSAGHGATGKARPFALDLGDAAFGDVEGDMPTPTASGLRSTLATAGGGMSGSLEPESASEFGEGAGKKSIYRSLGSVSDFGASDAEDGEDAYEVLEDDSTVASSDEDEEDDPELPTKEEVRDAARKIFGGDLIQDEVDIPRQAQEGVSHPTEGSTSSDRRPFDLEKVLGALQGMKDEIAGMEDEDERRKAAARVALALVYGLER